MTATDRASTATTRRHDAAPVGHVSPPGDAAPREGTHASGALLLRDVGLARTGPVDAVGPRPRERLADLVEHAGPRPRGEAGLVGRIDAAGLTGHGGGHVPTALKWRSILRGSGPLTVVGNGAESEPVSAKDAVLMRQRPHLVLDGLVLASEVLGAHRAVVWLHGDDDGARHSLLAALDERRSAGLVEPHVEVASGPVHYLAGESTAVANALRGGPALPTSRRPRPAEVTVPRTLVQNVETLARLALVARGLPSPRTSLLTVLGPSARIVVDVDPRTTFAEVLRRTGATPDGSPRAVLLGGYGGTWVPWQDIAERVVDPASLRAAGIDLGAGVLVPLPSEACGLVETASIAGYLATMSARQCGPCLFGLPALADAMRALATGPVRPRFLARLEADLGVVARRGACHHPDGAARLVASALAVFAADVADHLQGRPCPGSGRTAALPVPGAGRGAVQR